MANNKMSKILRCGDQNFWAYRFLSDEHIKYTRHDMEYCKFDEVNYKQDLLYIHSPDITPSHALVIPKLAKEKGVKVIGAYAGSPVFWCNNIKRVYAHSDLIVTISPQTYEFAKNNYPEGHPIVFLPESIDTEFFQPEDWDRMFYKKELIVGWAGGAHKKIKRTYLLDQLDFPVTIKSDWKDQRKNKVTTLDNMRPFYKSIDVLVITSESECMPRVALEAMACGIPVISTDVGGMRMLIDKEWIVPVNPEKNCVDEINTRLQILYKYPEVRHQVAYRNRKWMEENWSWKKNTTLWDDVFSLVIDNKVDEAVKMADKFLDKFDYCWDMLRERFRDTYFGTARGLNAEEEKRLGFEVLNSISPAQRVLIDINGLNIPCWVLKKTCSDCVKYSGKKLTSKLISIGLGNESDLMDMVEDLISLGYKKVSNCCVEKNEYIIEISVSGIQKTKSMALLDVQVLVPFPVKRYLRDIYGDRWENIK